MKPCDGKWRFETYGFAEKVAMRSRRKGETNRHVYKCRSCNGFHIGSSVGHAARRPVFA